MCFVLLDAIVNGLVFLIAFLDGPLHMCLRVHLVSRSQAGYVY